MTMNPGEYIERAERERAARQSSSQETEDYEPWMSQPRTPIKSRRIVSSAGGVELETDPIFTYRTGDGARYWDSYASETRKRLENQLVNAGILSKGGYDPGASNMTQHEAWEEVLGYANYYGITPFAALARLEKEGVATGRGRGGGGGGGGARGPVIEIPDYPTIAQNAKEMLRSTVGRDVQDYEIALIGAELQKQYQSWAAKKEQMALSNGGLYEVNDPNTMTQAFIEDQYAGEIERMGAMGEEQQNYANVMSVLTQGAKMVSG